MIDMTQVLNAAGWAFLSFWFVLTVLPPHGEEWKKLSIEKKKRYAKAQAVVSASIAVSIFLILL